MVGDILADQGREMAQRHALPVFDSLDPFKKLQRG
jgi:hypothetical protein